MKISIECKRIIQKPSLGRDGSLRKFWDRSLKPFCSDKYTITYRQRLHFYIYGYTLKKLIFVQFFFKSLSFLQFIDATFLALFFLNFVKIF